MSIVQDDDFLWFWLILILGSRARLWPGVLIVYRLFVILAISRFGIRRGLVLIDQVPVHCLLVTFGSNCTSSWSLITFLH